MEIDLGHENFLQLIFCYVQGDYGKEILQKMEKMVKRPGMSNKEYIELNKDKIDLRLKELYRSGEALTWKEFCDYVGIQERHGNAMVADINCFAELCKLKRVNNKGKSKFKYRYKVVEVKANIKHLGGWVEAENLCDRLNLELLEAPQKITNNSRLKCCCKTHGITKEVNYGNLKKGYRQFDCCVYEIGHLQASLYLYIHNSYLDAVIDGAKIIIPQLNKVILFHRGRSVPKEEADIVIMPNGTVSQSYSVKEDDGKTVIYIPVVYNSFSSRTKIFEEIRKYLPFEVKQDNWLEASILMIKYEAGVRGLGEKREVVENKLYRPYRTFEEKVSETLITGDEDEEDGVDFEQRLKNSIPVEKVHIVVTNKKLEIIDEFNSFNEIIDKIKEGNLFGLKWFFD